LKICSGHVSSLFSSADSALAARALSMRSGVGRHSVGTPTEKPRCPSRTHVQTVPCARLGFWVIGEAIACSAAFHGGRRS
jgi:hypothetical protein